MRQLSKILLLIIITQVLYQTPVYPAVKGGIQYSIPIEYENLNEQELEKKASKYFLLATNLPDNTVNDDMTNALMLYSILQNINPEKVLYSVKLGILYDKIGKDRYAKGNFSRAIGIDSSTPEPYFYLGEFYYKRQLYRKALKYYKEAENRTKSPNYRLYYKIGDIYEKFGDTKNALNYLEKASQQNPSNDLSNKINNIKAVDSQNMRYYSK